MAPSPYLKEDGKLGKQSIRAVQIFQESKGLVADGIIGAKTRLALELAQSTPNGCSYGALFNTTTGQACNVPQNTTDTPLVYTPNTDLATPIIVPEQKTTPIIPENKSTTIIYPSIAISSPVNNTTLGTNTVSLNFNASNTTTCWYDLGGLRVEDGSIGDPNLPAYQYQLPNCQSKTITLPNNNYVLNIWAKDANGEDALDSTWFRVLAPVTDTTPPIVTAFDIPSTSTTLTVPVSPFNATDNIGVTGRLLTETATTPSPTSGSWSSTTPTSYTFASAGSKTLYAWARDAAGNVSNSLSDSVLITTNTANTIYIDPTYSGTENGSITNPYNSWTDITFQNNTTYLQKRGTTQTISASLYISGRTGVTIGAYGSGSRPIINNTGTGHVVIVNSSTNTLLKDLELIGNANSSNESAGINFSGSSPSNNTIDNCVIHEIGNGVTGMEANNIKVLNTEIYNAKRDGIYFASITNAEIAYSHIHHVNLLWFTYPNNDGQSNGDGVQLDGNFDGINFHHNTIDRSATGNKFGLILANLNHYNASGVIEHNTFISPNNNHNIALYRGLNVLVRFNTFKDSHWGVRVGTNVNGTQIYGNIFKNSNLGIAVITGSSNTSIYNNVFYDVNEHINDIVTGTNIKNNIFHLTSTGDRALTGSGADVISNNCFSSGSGSGTNPIIGDPLFVNASAGDFHLQNGSPCINTGTNVGLTQDRDGTSIPQGSAPDIGAYESTTVLGVSTYHFTQKLELGSKGNEVKELQKILIAKGYLKGLPDSNFGKYTVWAVKAYQKANGLKVDGIVGKEMRDLLNK